MTVTVHVKPWPFAHCGALTGVQWSGLGGLKNYASPLLRISYRGTQLISHLLTCIRPSHYTLLPIMEVSPRPETSLTTSWGILAGSR
jgi:hypothetical protein